MLSAEAPRARRTPLHPPRALIPAVAALALLGAGCGDDDDDAGSASGATELTIALDADGPQGEPARTESVSCEPGDGSACGDLAAADFDPVPRDVACTEIYGGPDEASVEGTVAGDPVSATLTRANGCEIERFDGLTPVLRELFPGYEPGAAIGP